MSQARDSDGVNSTRLKKKKEKGKENQIANIGLSTKATKMNTPSAISIKDVNKMDTEQNWAWTALAESTTSIQPAVFTADGSYFFSVVGKSVKIYSVATGKVVSTLSSSPVGSSASRVASGEGHTDLITAAILNPENPFQLLTASLDGDIKVWDFLDAVLLRTIRIGQPISHICAHQKFLGQVFVSTLTKYDGTKNALYSMEKGNTLIYRVTLKPKQNTNSEICRPSETIRIGKTKTAVSMAVSPSGSWLVIVAGCKVYVSSTSTSEPVFTKFVSPERLTALAFHPSEDYFATGDEKGLIRLWYCLNSMPAHNQLTGDRRAQTTTMHWHAHSVSSLTFTSNGAYLLSGGEESVLVIWQLHSGKKEFVPRLGSPILSITVRQASAQSEEEYLAGLADGSFVFVNSGTLSMSRTIPRIKLDSRGMRRPAHSPIPLAIHAKTSSIVLPASHPSSLQLYAPNTSTLLGELEVSPSNRVSRRDEKAIEPSRVEQIAMSGCGNWMATVDKRENDEDFSVEVYLKVWKWESSGWTLNTRIDRPHGTGAVIALQFSPQPDADEGYLLVTAGLDKNIKTWCLQHALGKLGTYEGFWVNRSSFSFRAETPVSVSWSPDNSLLAVCLETQLALYDPKSSLLLDSLLMNDVKSPANVCFVGGSGRFLLVTGRMNMVLWDLITRTIFWQYNTLDELAQVIPHPKENIFAIVVQPGGRTLQTAKVLLFNCNSAQPSKIRMLPFRFRGVIWNTIDATNSTLVGITHSWDVVVCGDDPKFNNDLANVPREIDLSVGMTSRKTLFQDIFGKSAFAESAATTSPPRIAPQSHTVDKTGKISLEAFETPAYLAPPLETLYSTLIESFITKLNNQEEASQEEKQAEEGDDDMIIDTDVPQQVTRGRLVDDKEIEDLVKLFQMQSVDSVSQPVGSTNGIANDLHKRLPNGTSRSKVLKTPTSRSVAPSSDSPHLTSPVVVGKKRKESNS